jgi:hypothetical protein
MKTLDLALSEWRESHLAARRREAESERRKEKTMEPRKRYRERADRFVTAIRMNLETDCFVRRGSSLLLAIGDWLVYDGNSTYMVDAELFAEKYRLIGYAGRYAKIATVWVEVADRYGQMMTKDGVCEYAPGDRLVFHDPGEEEGFCMSPEEFERIYELESLVAEKGDEWVKASVRVASALNDVLASFDDKKKEWESALHDWLKEDNKREKGGEKCGKPSGETEAE